MPSRQQRRFVHKFCALVGGCWLAGMACGDGPSDDPHARVVVHFEHTISGAQMQFGRPQLDRYGRQLRVDELRYWVAHPQLFPVRDENADSGHHLLAFKPSAQLSSLEFDVPVGTYDGLEFYLGVAPELNHDAAADDDALARHRDTLWSPEQGHRFIMIAGGFGDPGSGASLRVELGHDEIYQRLRVVFDQSRELEADELVEIHVEQDIDRSFAGVDLAKSPVIEGGPLDSPAGRVAGNFARAFSLREGGGPVQFDVGLPAFEVSDADAGNLPTDLRPPQLSGDLVALDRLWCRPMPGETASAGCVRGFGIDSGWRLLVEHGAGVFAVSQGIVSAVEFREHSHLTHTDIYNVLVRPSSESAYTIEYRGLANVKVEVGNPVAPGQQLGSAAVHEHPEVGAVELAVRKRQYRDQYLCPSRFVAAPAGTYYADALRRNIESSPTHADAVLCLGQSLACNATIDQCGPEAARSLFQGDIDSGRSTFTAGCAGCHASVAGMLSIGGELCHGDACTCSVCGDQSMLAARIAVDMPPEGVCHGDCAADVAAYIVGELGP